MKQQIIFFEGPSNAGKSTAVDTLLKKHDRVFHINKDRIKWLISDYLNRVDGDKKMLENMLLSMCEHALDNGLSVFIEGQKDIVNEILILSNKKHVEIKYINIEAPLDILEERLQQRVQEAKKNGYKLGNTSNERLEAIYNQYLGNKYSKGITLDTSKLDKQEVVEAIEKYISE